MSSKGSTRRRKATNPHPWRVKECPSKKLGFPSGDEAKMYAKRATSTTLSLEAYECAKCNFWHVATPLRNGKVQVNKETPQGGN